MIALSTLMQLEASLWDLFYVFPLVWMRKSKISQGYGGSVANGNSASVLDTIKIKPFLKQCVKWINLFKYIIIVSFSNNCNFLRLLSLSLSLSLSLAIYIYCHPQTDCFVLSELFTVARHAGRSKPGSKPVQLYVRLSFRPLGHQADHVG